MGSRRKPTYKWDAESIKSLREHMGLSQQALADELEMRQQTISEWETGIYKPRRSTGKYLTIIAERAGFEYTVGGGERQEEENAKEGESEAEP